MSHSTRGSSHTPWLRCRGPIAQDGLSRGHCGRQTPANKCSEGPNASARPNAPSQGVDGALAEGRSRRIPPRRDGALSAGASELWQLSGRPQETREGEITPGWTKQPPTAARGSGRTRQGALLHRFLTRPHTRDADGNPVQFPRENTIFSLPLLAALALATANAAADRAPVRARAIAPDPSRPPQSRCGAARPSWKARRA
jgi:hypothetical protein